MDQRPRTIEIAGIDRTLNLMGKTLNITDKIPGKSTCSFELFDTTGLLILQEGQEVIIEDGINRIFAGEIRKYQGKEQSGVTYYSVSCVDYNGILDRVLLATAFDISLAGDMVRAIHSMKLATEGITLGMIEDGPTTSRSVFDWVSVSSAMDDIEKLTGITWNVDYYKVLNFFPAGYFTAPFNITTTSHNYSNLNIERNLDKYRNVQIFRPGWLETTEQTEIPTPKPDGSSRTFVVRFPLAKKPRIFINAIEVDTDDIGVNGLDKSGTKKWFFSRQSPQISQDSSETELPSGTELEIMYTGLYNRVFVTEDEDEIASRKLVEGGSGRHENYEDKSTIDDIDTTNQYITGLLRKYGSISNILTYQTHEHGLRAGMVQTVNVPSRGAVGSFLIESATARADGPGLMIYNVKAIDGEVVGGWVEFFRSLVIRSRDFAIRDNEFVSLLQNLTETDMNLVDDIVDDYQANPPFIFKKVSGNIVYGRWQWLDYTEETVFIQGAAFPAPALKW